MADKLPWFPFYGADFFGDETVLEMSNEEVGVYLRLLWHQWTNGSIPADRNRLAKLCGSRQLDLILSKFQTADDSGERLVNRKLLQIHTEQEDRRARLAQAGSKGGSSRATASLKPGYSDAQATEQSRTEQNKSKASNQPSQSETIVREAFQGIPDALQVAVDYAGHQFSRWAVLRAFGPGGTHEKPGVGWQMVAQGLVAAASLVTEDSRTEMNERLIAGCIRSLSRPRPVPPGTPIAVGVAKWEAIHEQSLKRAQEGTQ